MVMENVPIAMTDGTAEFTVLASAARTASVNTDLVNAGWRGIVLFVDVTVEPGAATLDVKLQVKDPASGDYIDLAGAAFAQISAVTSTPVMLTVYPGIAETANVSVSDALPRNLRVVATIGGTGGMTFSIGACYLP